MSRESAGQGREDQRTRINDKLEHLDDTSLVGKYKPTFLGLGGGHMVFTIEGHPNIVAKVDYGKLRKMIQIHNETGSPLDSLDDGLKGVAKKHIEEDKRRGTELNRRFPESTLSERAFLQSVPVTKELLAEALTDQDPMISTVPEGTHSIVTLVRIQERAPDKALDNNAMSVVFQYLERDKDFDLELYEQANDMLLDSNTKFDESVFRQLLNPDGISLLDKMQKEKKLVPVIRDFVEKAISYINETGEGLDLAGESNVAIFEDGNEWNYLLLDAKYDTPNLIKRAQAVMEKVRSGVDIEESEANELMNTMNIVRLLNGLSSFTGSSSRLEIFDKPVKTLSASIFEQVSKHNKKKHGEQ